DVVTAPGAHATLEYRLRRPDGTWAWIEQVVTNLLNDPAVGGVVGNLRDITSRREAEEARRRSEERLDAVLANLPVVLFAFDEAGTCTLAEGALVFGSAEEYLGRSTAELYAEAGIADAQDHIARTLAGEAFEVSVDNGPRTFDVRFQPIV